MQQKISSEWSLSTSDASVVEEEWLRNRDETGVYSVTRTPQYPSDDNAENKRDMRRGRQTA